MGPETARNNEASRHRLLALVEHLDEQALHQQLEDGWTIAAHLAHVAFWDRICVTRWDAYDRAGSLAEIPGPLIDIINAANFPTWRALPGHAAVELLRHAMEETDARIAGLPDAAARAAISSGITAMLDRSGHRNEHAAQIAAFIAEQPTA